jgi:hypothetical protein
MYDNSGAAPRRSRKRQDFVDLDTTHPKRAFASGRPWESKVMVLFVWQNGKSWYKCRFRFFQNRMVNPYEKISEPGFPHNFAKKK